MLSIEWLSEPGNPSNLKKTREASSPSASESKRTYENQGEILQKIFDHIPVMINFFGEDGRLKLVNREWEQRLGWGLEELQGRDFYADLYPDPSDRQRLREFLKQGGGWGDFRPTIKSGEVIDTAWTVVHLSDGSRIGIGQDTTERKRAENALRESEERFRQIAEHVREVCWMRAVGLKQALYVSPTFDRVWGISREDLYQDLGRLVETVHPEDRSVVAELLARPPETGFECEYRIIRPDGTVRWIWDRGFPIRDQGGQIYRFAGIAEDITERKLAQNRLRETSEQLRALSARALAAREEERTRIAREIHDELGSSLTCLKWELEALDKAVSQVTDLTTQIAPIRKRIASMTQLADATVSQVRRIASELRPSILDDLGLGEALEWQAKQFETRHGIVCRCENRLDQVNLNPDQSTAVFRIVHEALTNILRHAQATWVGILVEQRAGEFILTVSDNGRGIREQEKTGRSSLGLLGMKERVHLVGGEIDITGVAGCGTTVTVTVKGTKVQLESLSFPIVEPK